MSVYYSDDHVTLHHGDCLEVLRSLPDASVDAVVCDPPYGLGFMGKEWDSIKQAESRPPSAGVSIRAHESGLRCGEAGTRSDRNG